MARRKRHRRPPRLLDRQIKIGDQKLAIRVSQRPGTQKSKLIKSIHGHEHGVLVVAIYRGKPDLARDKKIRRAFGGATSSGYYFRTRERDFVKDYAIPNKARQAIVRLRKIGFKLRFKIYELFAPAMVVHIAIGPKTSMYR